MKARLMQVWRLCAFALLPALLAHAAAAQSPEPYYKGRTITIFSGFTPGGSYDYYSRLLARHLGRHLAGQPSLVVQTMPGAGGLNAANHLFNNAARDGTVIGILSQTLAIEEAMGAPRIQYKAGQFQWIGRITSTVEVTVTWNPAKITRIEQARSQQLLLATTGPGSALDSYPRVLAQAGGFDFRFVSGYKGSSEALLAMEKGEVEGTGTTWNALKISRRNWLDEKRINILVQYSRSRAADLTDVPAAVELGRTEEDKALLEFYMGGAEVGRAFLAPPGVPQVRMSELRTAFDAAMKDPELVADVKKANAEFAPLPGRELEKLIAATLAVKPELAARVRDMLPGRK
jgi:tripartite-type tricarboxylate transporter receptor subunit TctC